MVPLAPLVQQALPALQGLQAQQGLPVPMALQAPLAWVLLVSQELRE